jgi:membrane protein implicated in regulation of membrane protease activity
LLIWFLVGFILGRSWRFIAWLALVLWDAIVGEPWRERRERDEMRELVREVQREIGDGRRV